jgi:hypothetical protein
MPAAAAKVPLSAAWLGGLGALPFIGLAGALPFLVGAPKRFAVEALVAYGETILSFLGGIHWGLAIAPQGDAKRATLPVRLTFSIIPSLAAWAALLVPDTSGLFVLAAAIAAMLWVDLRATRAAEAPAWYPTLRLPLTCIVVAALLLGAMFSNRAADRHHSIDGVRSAKSAFVGRSAAHQRHDLVRGHLEVTPPTKALDELLSPGLAAGGARRLDQTDNARLDHELDIGSRHKPGAFPHVLRNGDLAFARDPHGVHFLTNYSKSGMSAA